MNVLNEASMTAYAGAIEEAIKDDKVKGIILTSAQADFIAGADLEMLLSTDTSDAASDGPVQQLQKMFRRQETGGKPIVAAINGTRWAAASRSASPATTASPRPTPRPKSASPRSRSACCRAAAARSASRA